MPDVDGASSQETGPAAADSAFDKAFNAAVESSSIDEDVYQPAAEATGKPVVSDSIEPADSPPADGKPTTKADKAQETPAVAPADGVSAPANWDEKRRAAFDALPTPEAKQVMLDMAKGMEAEFTRKTTEHAGDLKLANGIRSLITDQHRAQMRSANMDEVQGVAHLIKLNDYATRDPAGYIRWVIEQTGVGPNDVFPNLAGAGGEPSQEQGQQPDPYNQFYGLLQSLGSKVESFEQKQAQTELRQASRAIDTFRAAKNDGGESVHPHFDKVEQEMTRLLMTPQYQAIEDFGERLNRAYDTAVYMDPDIRSQNVESEVQKRLREQQKTDDVAKAKRAQAPVKSTPTGPAKTKATTIDDALNNAMSMTGVGS
jgi:hypothetical protein